MARKKKESTQQKRKRRQHYHMRLLARTSQRLRLSVYRSSQHIYVQIIDDRASKTIVAASSLDKTLRETIKYGGNLAAAERVGVRIAEKAQEKNITQVVFDRGGFAYHGRIKALADAARKGGLVF